MPCLFVIIAILAPRLAILILWLSSSWFTGMFPMKLWPVLGFVFMPTTLLWYSVVENWLKGQWGAVAIAGIVVAILIDMSPASGRRKR